MRPLSSRVAAFVKLVATTARGSVAAAGEKRSAPKRSAATVVFPEPGWASMKIPRPGAMLA